MNLLVTLILTCIPLSIMLWLAFDFLRFSKRYQRRKGRKKKIESKI